jgi:hypothetical protein
MPELAEVETQKTAGFVDRGYNYELRRLQNLKLNNVENQPKTQNKKLSKKKRPIQKLKKQRYLQKKNLLKNDMVI